MEHGGIECQMWEKQRLAAFDTCLRPLEVLGPALPLLLAQQYVVNCLLR